MEQGPSVLRHLPAFVQNMTDGDASACQLDHGLWWVSALFIIVNVAGDGGDRNNLLQLLNHRPIADVPGVEEYDPRL